MTWLGVSGNVQGVLMARRCEKKGNVRESLLLRAGVVGSQLPALQAASASDRAGRHTFFLLQMESEAIFSVSLSARENPQRAADRILEHYGSGK